MRIAKKLAVNNYLISLVVLLLAVTFFFIARKTIDVYSEFYNNHVMALDKLRRIELNYREVEFMLTGVKLSSVNPGDAANHITRLMGEISKLWGEAEKLVPPGENRQERESIGRGHDKFRDMAKSLIPKLQDGDLKEMDSHYEKWLDVKNLLMTPIDNYVNDRNDGLYKEFVSYRDLLLAVTVVIIGAALAVVIIFMLGSSVLLRSIKNMFNDVSVVLTDLVTGEGNLAISVFKKKLNCSDLKKCGCRECGKFGTENNDCMFEVGSLAPRDGKEVKCPSILSGKLRSCTECEVYKTLIHDEIDEFLFNIEWFIRKLRAMVINIKEVSFVLSSSSVQLSRQADSFSANSQTQAASTEEISASMDLVKVGQDTAGDTIVLFNELMTHIVSKLAKSMESAEKSGERMKDAMNSKNMLDKILARVQDTNREITERMGEAREVAQGTKEIIQSVNDISEQINLLSLNAAIEAARAGDQGRGFAVVADEIGKLSDLTHENVKGITDKIENTTKVINMVNEDIKNVVDSIRTVIDEITKFGMIVEEINTMLGADNRIKKGIQSDSRTMFDSSGLITNSILDTKSAFEEIVRAMHSINEVIQENSAGAEEMSANTEEMAHVADKLKTLVGQFRV